MHLHDRVRDVLTLRLKRKVEGVCTRHGFVRHDSIRVSKVLPGRVDAASLSGMTHFTIVYTADACLPWRGMRIIGTVKAVSRFGVMVECGYERGGGGGFVTVMEVVVPRETNVDALTSRVPLDRLTTGDTVKAVVQGRKIEWGNAKISAVGRIVEDFEEDARNDDVDQRPKDRTDLVDGFDGGGESASSDADEDDDVDDVESSEGDLDVEEDDEDEDGVVDDTAVHDIASQASGDDDDDDAR